MAIEGRCTITVLLWSSGFVYFCNSTCARTKKGLGRSLNSKYVPFRLKPNRRVSYKGGKCLDLSKRYNKV